MDTPIFPRRRARGNARGTPWACRCLPYNEPVPQYLNQTQPHRLSPVEDPLARRIGLINTMVFTHLPANLCLVAVPFATGLWQAIALLLLRSLLSQMDVPTRTSYVMAVVTPAERQA